MQADGTSEAESGNWDLGFDMDFPSWDLEVDADGDGQFEQWQRFDLNNTARYQAKWNFDKGDWDEEAWDADGNPIPEDLYIPEFDRQVQDATVTHLREMGAQFDPSFVEWTWINGPEGPVPVPGSAVITTPRLSGASPVPNPFPSFFPQATELRAIVGVADGPVMDIGAGFGPLIIPLLPPVVPQPSFQIAGSYAHTQPGVQSEVYVEISGNPGDQVETTLFGGSVLGSRDQSGTIGEDGLLRLTWVIDRFATYTVQGTVEAEPFSVVVDVK
jgi:hypothetical protein